MRLTLADLETEIGEYEPFEIDLGDDVIVSLPHPEKLPADTLLKDVGPMNAGDVLRTMMGADNFATLTEICREDGNKRVTIGHLRLILEKYYAHYGLGTPGEDSASRSSSTGSARPSKSTSRRKAKA